MGRVTSDVIRGMSVTQFIGVGHIAKLVQHSQHIPTDSALALGKDSPSTGSIWSTTFFGKISTGSIWCISGSLLVGKKYHAFLLAKHRVGVCASTISCRTGLYEVSTIDRLPPVCIEHPRTGTRCEGLKQTTPQHSMVYISLSSD